MDIVNRIIGIVEQHGLTGKDLGRILNLKKSPLTDWKNQKSKPTLDQIITICEYFAVSSDYILLGKNNNHNLNDINLSNDETELVITYRELDYENKAIMKGELFKLIKDQRSSNQKDGISSKRKAT